MDAGSHDPGASAPLVLLPKHLIFLSHSGQEKAFMQELNKALIQVNHSPFFDQNEDSLPKGERFPDLIFRAAQQCRVAVIVLSEGYLTSKWPMLELVEFHKSMKAGNPITLLPAFYKLKPDEIDSPKWMKFWSELFIKQDEAHLVEKCKDAVHALKSINGLIFQGNDHIKYKDDLVLKICKLWPPPKPFDTSDMQGCDRLCKLMSELFKEHNGIHYLGIYGIRGSGKSKQCQAMYNHYQSEEYAVLKFCILDLGDDKTTENQAKKKREKRLKIAIEQLVGSNQIMSGLNLEEAQLRKYLKDRAQNQPVFLVVENVSQSSINEAEFYVKAGYDHGSRVLVTSRSRSFLEEVFGGRQYSDFCHPVPLLNDTEAAQLVLARAAPGTLLTDLNDNEKKNISEFCADFSKIEGYHPSLLIALGSFLRRRPLSYFFAYITENGSWPIWNLFHESEEAGDMYAQLILPEYNHLSRTAKLIFLDVARYDESKLYSASWRWNECNNLTDATIYISHLHDLSLNDVQIEVKKLQENNFLKESRTELVATHFYYLFAGWLLNAGDVDREEKKWFVVYRQELDDEGRMTWPEVPVETVTRVILIQPFIYSDEFDEFVMKGLQQFTHLVYLELVQVENLQKLDLRGLSSLRVIKVEKCKELKEIGCNCAFFIPVDLEKCRCLKDLRTAHLIDLPSLKDVSFALHCSNLKSVLIYDCPKVVEAPYQFPSEELKRLVSPRVGISPSNSATEDMREWVSDAVTGQFSIGYLIYYAFRIFIKSVIPPLVGMLRHRYATPIISRLSQYPVTEGELGLNIEVTRANSICVGWHKQLIILDLTASRITEGVGLSHLRNLEALCLYCCTELLTLPDLVTFTKLKRLCIGHCHKLAKTLPRENVPENVEDFHSLGDKCNFGEHECLDCLDLGEGNCEECDKDVLFHMERGENSGGETVVDSFRELGTIDQCQPVEEHCQV